MGYTVISNCNVHDIICISENKAKDNKDNFKNIDCDFSIKIKKLWSNIFFDASY